MDKIRLGKDIAVRWQIKVNGQDVPLEGMELILTVWTESCRNEKPVSFSIIEGNIIGFTWKGEEQSYTGVYNLSLYKKDSPKSIIDAPFVQLVERTWDESDSPQSDLQTETVELTASDLELGGDYNLLFNKPSLNEHTLEGDTSLKTVNGQSIIGEGDINTKTAYASLRKVAPLFYQAHYNELDYDYAFEFFADKAPANIGSCSAIFKDGKFGRNFDWFEALGNDQDQPEFWVTTPKTRELHGVMGTASCPQITEAIAKADAQNELWKVLPFYLQDGINDTGLFACMNVVPRDKGNNTKTVPTSSKVVEVNELMLVRWILDHFSSDSVSQIVNYIKEHVSVAMSQSLIDMHYDVHIIVGSALEQYVIEFVNNQVVITQTSLMTNFHVQGVTFLDNGKVYTNKDVENSHLPSSLGITSYGSGLERYNKLVEGNSDMRTLMNSILYSKAYDLEESPYWYSEFVNTDTEHNVTTDSLPNSASMQYMIQAAQDIKAGLREGRLWQTTHSVVYDINSLTANVVSFEDTSCEYYFSFGIGAQLFWGNIKGTLSDQEDLQAAFDAKVDIVEGKQLSTNDYTDADKGKVDNYTLIPYDFAEDWGEREETGARIAEIEGIIAGRLDTMALILYGEKYYVAKIVEINDHYHEFYFVTSIDGDPYQVCAQIAYGWWKNVNRSQIATSSDVSLALTHKQDTLVSGQNIKTIGQESILGQGNLSVLKASVENENLILQTL